MRYAPVRQPLSVTLLLVVVVLVLIGVGQTILMQGVEIAPQNDRSVGSMLIDYLFGGARGYVDRISLVLYFSVALYTIKMTVGKMVLEKRTYLAAVFYLLYIGVMSSGDVTLEAGLVAILFVGSCSLFLQSFRRDTSSYDYVFRAGFVLGVMPLLFAPALLLFPLVIVACAVFRRSFKEYNLAVCAYLLPLLICSYVCWALGYPIYYVAENIWTGLRLADGSFVDILDLPIEKLIFVGVYLLLALVAIAVFYGRVETLRNSSIRMFTMFVFAIVLCLAMMALPGYSVITSIIAALPFAIVIPAFFAVFRSWQSLLIYIVVLGFAFAVMVLSLLQRIL